MGRKEKKCNVFNFWEAKKIIQKLNDGILERGVGPAENSMDFVQKEKIFVIFFV